MKEKDKEGPPAEQSSWAVLSRCKHAGIGVNVGPYRVYAGGGLGLQPLDLVGMDVIVPLTEGPMPFGFGKRYEVFAAPLRDFGGVPRSWRRFLEQVIEELEQGKNLLAFCGAGHGRTGTFLASLIALLESADETPDPIAAVRERYCDLAVETLAQAEGIFNLRHETVPGQYQREFARPLWGTLFSSLDPLRLDLLLGRQPRHQGDDKKK